MKNLIRLFVASFVLFFAAPAMAKNVVADVDQIAGVLKGAGHMLEIKTADGERYISSEIAGYKYALLFFGCDDTKKNCKSVQFFVAFTPKTKPTLDAMNGYAKDHRWGRIYLDKDGDPAMEFDLDLEQGGMSEELFLDNVAYWEAIVGGFAKFVFGED
jgi:Putative bacterial sensory transduction regulator